MRFAEELLVLAVLPINKRSSMKKQTEETNGRGSETDQRWRISSRSEAVTVAEAVAEAKQ